jgi:hypothetical protein
MFKLRDIATQEAVEALASGFKDTSSPVFRHEIAYVFGQLQVCRTDRDSWRSKTSLLQSDTEWRSHTGLVCVHYVLQDRASLPALKQVLEDSKEHCMVRHEAAEAIGSIADEVRLLISLSSPDLAFASLTSKSFELPISPCLIRVWTNFCAGFSMTATGSSRRAAKLRWTLPITGRPMKLKPPSRRLVAVHSKRNLSLSACIERGEKDTWGLIIKGMWKK